MGNIPASDLSKVDVELDKEILSLQTSALFNDGYVSSIVEQVPHYGYQETIPQSTDQKAADIEEVNANDHEQRLEKFMTIFSSNFSGCSKVEDFPILSVDKSLANSGFAIMSRRRSRLLLRLFQVRRRRKGISSQPSIYFILLRHTIISWVN
jgi:hypothetical protein